MLQRPSGSETRLRTDSSRPIQHPRLAEAASRCTEHLEEVQKGTRVSSLQQFKNVTHPQSAQSAINSYTDMSTSSEEEASTATATAPRLYRLQNLELASVFIHRMSIAEAPADVCSLADFLTYTHFRGVLDCSEVRLGRSMMIICSWCQ